MKKDIDDVIECIMELHLPRLPNKSCRMWVSVVLYICLLYCSIHNKHIPTRPTIFHQNNETNDKFYRKITFLIYTEVVNFRPKTRKPASKPKSYRGLGTRLPSS